MTMIFKKLKELRKRKNYEKGYTAHFDRVLISNKVIIAPISVETIFAFNVIRNAFAKLLSFNTDLMTNVSIKETINNKNNVIMVNRIKLSFNCIPVAKNDAELLNTHIGIPASAKQGDTDKNTIIILINNLFFMSFPIS